MTKNLELARKLPKPKSGAIAIIALSGAIAAVSLAAIFIKLSEREIGPNATVFNRLWIATVVFGFWNGFDRNLQKDSSTVFNEKKFLWRDRWLLLLMGCVSSLSLGCWAWSLTQTSIANSTVLRNLTPLFTSLGGWLLLDRRFDRKFVFGMVLAIAGATIIGWGDWQIGLDSMAGDVMALLAAMFYGANLLIVEHLRTRLKTSRILLWRCAIGALLLFPIVALTEDKIFPDSWDGWLAVVSLALVCQAFGQGLLVYSLKKFSSGFVALFLLLEPILTACFAWIIFAEELSWLNGLAFVVVLLGIYVAKSNSSNFDPKVRKPDALDDEICSNNWVSRSL